MKLSPDRSATTGTWKKTWGNGGGRLDTLVTDHGFVMGLYSRQVGSCSTHQHTSAKVSQMGLLQCEEVCSQVSVPSETLQELTQLTQLMFQLGYVTIRRIFPPNVEDLGCRVGGPQR